MATAKKPTGYILYEGPSMLDGAPIVAIALVETSNRKTGDMVQTYIIRQDVKPTEALKTGQDASVCGDCKHRPVNGGSCYVNVGQGVLSVWKSYMAGNYPMAQDVAALGEGRMVRLGTYGDPMAVPAHIWEALVAQAEGRTGYTHQWANEALPVAQREAITRLTMASADTPAEAQAAKAQGLRYFRIRLATEPLERGEFMCPASDEAGKRRTCDQCGACNGSEKAQAASPVIIAHGVDWKVARYVALRAA